MKKLAVLCAFTLFLSACQCNCRVRKDARLARQHTSCQQSTPAAEKAPIIWASSKTQPEPETKAATIIASSKTQNVPVKISKARQSAVASATKQAQSFSSVATVAQTGNKLNISYKRPISFEIDSDVIAPASNTQISQTAKILKKYPNSRIAVYGHTDSIGEADHNLELSTRRAKAVSDALEQHGVNGSRLSYIGYGETRPIAQNGTRAGRAKNRRVELEITVNRSKK